MKYPNLDLGTIEAVFNKLGGMEGAQAFLRGERNLVSTTTSERPQLEHHLLETVSTVALDAVERFNAKDKFRERKSVDGVQITWIGSNFQNNFGRKVEENVAAAELKIHKLLEASRDMPIIHELGGEEVAETTLAHMWEMLKRQGRGESGTLLVNGYANILYIRDVNSVLWAVDCGWHSVNRGWGVGAGSVGFPGRWGGGGRVVSR